MDFDIQLTKLMIVIDLKTLELVEITFIFNAKTIKAILLKIKCV